MIAEINFKAREIKNNLVGPLSQLLKKIGLSANILTAFNLIFGILSAIFLYKDYELFVLFWSLSFICDGLDGPLARLEEKTPKGWIFDNLTDRFVMSALIFKSLLVFKTGLILVALIFYITINALIIYDKVIIGHKKNRIFYFDIFVFALFIFQYYYYAIWGVIVISFIHFLQFVGQFFFRPRYE